MSSKKSPSLAKGQKTLFSFFQKSPAPTKAPSKAPLTPTTPAENGVKEVKREQPSTPTPLEKQHVPPKEEIKSRETTTFIERDSTTESDQVDQGLSTPMSSSQPLPSSSPTRRIRSKRKTLVIDSDSEDEAARDPEDSEDDWEQNGNAQTIESDDDFEMGDAVEEESDASVEEPLSDDEDSKSKKPARKPLKRSSPSADPSELNSSPAKTPARSSTRLSSSNLSSSAAVPSSPADSLAKFTKFSDYTPETLPSSPSRVTIPLMKKVRVSEDPERYKWLLNIKDADGKSPEDPDYDPRTLYIPQSAWAKFTPFEKQYWEVKQNLWNTVVFFKKGKFYELYENDAAIAHQQFDLKLAGGGRANMSLCGVPEMSFDYWASAFIAKGYKVARVDQSETALGKEMRDIANKKKEEKIIRRELSFVLTGGTLTDASMLVSDLSQYCMTIKQDDLDFAACFVDTASSQFYLARFTDKSADFPLLETLIAQVRPKELVIARGNLSKYALKVIKNNTSVETLWETAKPDTEFWDADTTRREIDLDSYFPEGASTYPPFLVKSLEDDELSASAIGGLVWYLRSLKLDKQLIGLGQFHEYTSELSLNGASMIVDGQTLQNLEVFANSWDGGAEGTLFKLINKCITPFGKRRLRSWIIHPLRNTQDIAYRADAVEMFMTQDEVADTLSNKLINLPDTERMLSRVHAGTLRPRDFVKLVGGLESMARLLTWVTGLRTQLPQLEPFLGSATSELEKTIEPWLTAFDHVEAKNNDKLIPEKGVDEEFDRRKYEVSEAEKELREVMKIYCQEFKSNALEFRDSGKEIYLIEVPAKLTKQVPRDWQQMGATAKFKRYWSPEVKVLVRTLQEAQERLNMAAVSCQWNLYRRFCTPANYEVFMEASRVISALDCLLSLAKTSARMAVHCRPEFIAESKDTAPIIDFSELRHPVATNTDFIPNDVHLGGDDARLSLLTGANAAGKSTVLRTTCSAVLLAQLGCHVPASEARLTPVDRIMTRLGASDNIFAGKSTFHMELAETERILSESTKNSLVVIDELGRGGSSSDGFAIAEAVLHHLATHIGCMGFFATHYATLYDSFETHPGVKPERMAIDVDHESRNVTFMYKLEPGRSEGSFGMNVAAMCGVSANIVNAAEMAAKKYEHTSLVQKKLSVNSHEAVTLGEQSDVAWSTNHSMSELAVRVMLAMSQ